MIEIRKLLVVALVIRLILAPFFGHTWDMNTIQNSMNLFASGSNPYEYFSSVSKNLQTTTGLPVFFEGYAYLPHLLFILAPFHMLYLSTGADPMPIKDIFLPDSQTGAWFSPDIFLFLFLMKLPLILMDMVAVYLLYKLKPKVAILYALSPYAILISAIWGMFDGILAVSLLLSVILFYRHKFFSGMFFGLSLIKPIPILALPIYLAILLKERSYKGMALFFMGIIIMQIPTLYYLLADSNSFLNNVVIFHLKRTGGGVTPLNIMWNIPDLFFKLAATSYATIAFVIGYIAVLFLIVKKGVTFEYGIIIVILLYLMLGKLVNEQYLMILYPLLLWKLNEAKRLDKYLILFAMLSSTPVYFALPTLSFFNFYVPLVTSWYSFLALEYINFGRTFLMYLVGLLFFLKVADTMWLAYRKNIRSKQETDKKIKFLKIPSIAASSK